MTESLRATELRREIAELEAQGDHLDPAMTEAMLASLRADLAEELGEAPAAPSLPRIRPWASAAPTTTTPAAPAAQEMPMPKKYSPQQKLEALHQRLLAARTAGKPAHKLAHEIRACCEEHGLAVPDEARLRQARKTAAKPPATAPQASASPVAPAAERAAAPRALCAAQSPAPGAGEPQAPAPVLLAEQPGHLAFGRRLVHEAAALGFPGAGPDASAHIRALRSKALEMLPGLEDLRPEDAARAHDEMDLLAQTLVLGGKLIARGMA